MVAVLLVASSRLELRWKVMGALALFIPALSTMLELWESPLWFVHLVEFEAEGQELFLEQGEASCQGVRVSVEGEVVLINVHSRVWVGISRLVFGYSSVHSQGEDEARHGASSGQSPFQGVGDDITIVELTRELLPPP